MCLIGLSLAAGEERAPFSADTLRRAVRQNPDGAGIMYVHDARLRVERFPPGQGRAFIERVLHLQTAVSGPLAWHVRLATRGSKDELHPFWVQRGSLALMHNGHLDIPVPRSQWSDSRGLAQVLARLPARWWEADALRWLVENAILGSRVLLMSNDSEVVRLGRGWVRDPEAGHWYSNASWSGAAMPKKWEWLGDGAHFRLVTEESERPKIEALKTEEAEAPKAEAPKAEAPKAEPAAVPPVPNVRRDEDWARTILWRLEGVTLCRDCKDRLAPTSPALPEFRGAGYRGECEICGGAWPWMD